jgi:hypothetical protein
MSFTAESFTEEKENFALEADCHHVKCDSRPELSVLRHKLIPVEGGDFDLYVSAVRRRPGDTCPFQKRADELRAAKREKYRHEDEYSDSTPASIFFSLCNWGDLRFRWPLRKDSQAHRARKFRYTSRPQVSYGARETDTGADLRRVVHEVLLPQVRGAGTAPIYCAAGIDDAQMHSFNDSFGDDYLKSCVTRQEFEAFVAASMEALAAFVDSHGGTFGSASIPGAHDPITECLWYDDADGNFRDAIFGTEHWWYDVTYRTS